MTSAVPPGAVVCADCGTSHERHVPYCRVCGRDLRAARPGTPGHRIALGRGTRLRYDDSLGVGDAVSAVAAIVIVFGIVAVAPPLLIPVALVATPILIAGRRGNASVGWLSAVLLAIAICAASLIAFFMTCSAVYGSGGSGRSSNSALTVASVVGVLTAIGLTVVVIRVRRGKPAPPRRHRIDVERVFGDDDSDDSDDSDDPAAPGDSST